MREKRIVQIETKQSLLAEVRSLTILLLDARARKLDWLAEMYKASLQRYYHTLQKWK